MSGCSGKACRAGGVALRVCLRVQSGQAAQAALAARLRSRCAGCTLEMQLCSRLPVNVSFQHLLPSCIALLYCRPQIQECVLQDSLEGLARYCQNDSQCQSFVYRPGVHGLMYCSSASAA